MDHESAHQSFLWSRHLLHRLIQAGITQCIISPGSRSTPLVLAAATFQQLSKTIILDERSAAFTALGMAKATGKPAVLICTSGTAVANYLPAVVEARQSAVPMILLTADRPPEARKTQHHQTINQVRIFGDYVSHFKDSGDLPYTDHPGDYAATDDITQKMISGCLNDSAPVHFNISFKKPLEPESEAQIENLISSQKLTSDPLHIPVKKSEPLKWLQKILNKYDRPLIISGPVNHFSSLFEVSRQLIDAGIPCIAESSSQLRCFEFSSDLIFKKADSFFRSPQNRKRVNPDLIIRIGTPPVSKSLELFLKDHENTEQVCFYDGFIPPDSESSSRKLFHIPANSDLSDDITLEFKAVSKWIEGFSKLSVESEKTGILKKPSFTDGDVADTIWKSAKNGRILTISNSFSVRDIDLFAIDTLPYDQAIVNRGASGIDGVISTGAGASMASGKPCDLLIGDLAFLHDSNALQLQHSGQDFSLRIIVANNSGGTIFRMLPVSRHENVYTKYFETPQSVDIRKLCEANSVSHKRITSSKTLLEELNKKSEFGITVLECITSSDDSMAQRKVLWEAFSRK